MTRSMIAVAVLAALALGAAPPAPAQEAYPTRPVTIVAAFPPGGVADLTARPVAAALERIFKQPVVVANKPGAAGAVGNQFVAHSKPDGYTLLMALVSVSVLPEVDRLFGRPTTYTREQLVGIARVSAEPAIITVRSDSPWKTLKDLVDDARRRPGQITFSSSGLYGASHVPFEMFLHAAGVRMRHLPTTGGAPMMNALLGGHADTTSSSTVLVAPHVKAGKLRLLAHTGTQPMKAFPEVPSMKSLGYDVEYAAWAGLVAPRATPAPVIKTLREAMRRAVQESEIVNSHAKLEASVAYLDADEFNAYWEQDARKLAGVIKAIGKVESAK
ncbi:MAG: tripartite tricarboxylate transporter substrate binding protein [Candidatus Rokuibacteriota bacterium]